MPIPKGINDPAVRAAWLAGRRDKLAEFDRLVGKGYGVTKAARAVSMSVASVRAMRSSIVTWEDEGRQHGAQRERIDLGLALLSVLRKPGECLTLEDMAAWCDCPQQSIARIERRALRKLRQWLSESDLRADAGLEDLIPFPVRVRLARAA